MFLTDMACERAVDMPRAFSAAATVSIGVQILQDEWHELFNQAAKTWSIGKARKAAW
jgi:hypothetical protein